MKLDREKFDRKKQYLLREREKQSSNKAFVVIPSREEQTFIYQKKMKEVINRGEEMAPGCGASAENKHLQRKSESIIVYSTPKYTRQSRASEIVDFLGKFSEEAHVFRKKLLDILQ